jgi:hypothetical protein
VIEQMFKTFTHVDKINWVGYDPIEHECILLHDVKGIENYLQKKGKR